MKTVKFTFKSSQYEISFDASAKRLVITMPHYRKDYARTATFPVWWEVDPESETSVLNCLWEVMNAASIGLECTNYDYFKTEHGEGLTDEEITLTYDQYQECRIGLEYFRYRSWNAEKFCSDMMDTVQSLLDYIRDNASASSSVE